VSSPYVKAAGVAHLLNHIPDSLARSGSAVLLTDLRSWQGGASDLSAVLSMSDALPALSVRHLPSVHAKVYVSDRAAIITSGNLTRGGLFANFEYGVWLEDAALVSAAWNDMSAYAAQGSLVPRENIAKLRDMVAPLERREPVGFPPGVEEEIDRILVLPRLTAVTLHGTFRDTLDYLLKRDGPSTIGELHQKIQAIHPDLCDDRWDRVIDGRHYGKKWKHAIRTSMQSLKRKGLVELVGDRWRLVR
jgi:phosphatidylserine/phosphatidylglycerophosphate/cardiolipin synthase-like enzyme